MSSVATLPTESRYDKVSCLTCVVLIWFHIQAVVALFEFSWTRLFVALTLYWISVGLGISMGYHRLHTHRGFKTFKLFEYFLAVCGTLTLEGGPLFWVATHRLASSVFRSGTTIRTRLASADSGRTSAGSSSARRTTTTPRACRATRPIWRRIRSIDG